MLSDRVPEFFSLTDASCVFSDHLSIISHKAYSRKWECPFGCADSEPMAGVQRSGLVLGSSGHVPAFLSLSFPLAPGELVGLSKSFPACSPFCSLTSSPVPSGVLPGQWQ